MTEPLPCVCGEIPAIVGDDRTWYQVQCPTYLCLGRGTFARRDDAVERWNRMWRRPAPEPAASLDDVEW